jgi:hypothetical protein
VWIERRRLPGPVSPPTGVDFLPKTFDVENVGRIAAGFIPRLADTKAFPVYSTYQTVPWGWGGPSATGGREQRASPSPFACLARPLP